MLTQWLLNNQKGAVLATIAMLIITIPSILSASAGTSASIRYVAPVGSDMGDCRFAMSPCRTIQYAVNRASSGDTILVAAGVYTYNSSVDPCLFLPPQGKSVVCVVDKALTVLGGYSTDNWWTANPSVNLTIIDGEGRHRGVFLIGYNTTTTTLRMEGFTIQNCRAEGPDTPGDPSGFGGGMLVAGANVALRDVIFKNNKVYGQNVSSGVGGAGTGGGLAINWSQPGTSSLLERVTFEGNQSFGGTGPVRGGVAFGALFVNGSVTITHATFINNQAIAGNSTGPGQSSDGLCADALGGAIGGGGSSWVLRYVIARNNQVIGGNGTQCAGGGFGGAIHIEEATSLFLSDSLFISNTARGGNALTGGFGAGGGILVNNTPATIERVWLIANSAIGGNSTGGGGAGPGGGGGLYLWRTSPGVTKVSLINSVIADNFVARGSVGNPQLGGGGGGIQVQGLQADIIHTTIARNRLGPGLVSGQGLLVLGMQGVGPGVANVDHSIIANHQEGAENAVAVLVQKGNTINFNRGLFAGNIKDTNADGVPMPPGTINGLATMLSAPSAGFISPGPPNYDYHIGPLSPAIDQAVGSTTSLDIDGQPRPYGTSSDLGADEYYRPKLTATPPEVTVMVEGEGAVGRTVFIGAVYTTTTLSWNASTTATWLSLEPSQGQTGGTLVLRFNPGGLDLGTYSTTVAITSPDADPATLLARMIKVDRVFWNYLPIVLRR